MAYFLTSEGLKFCFWAFVFICLVITSLLVWNVIRKHGYILAIICTVAANIIVIVMFKYLGMI